MRRQAFAAAMLSLAAALPAHAECTDRIREIFDLRSNLGGVRAEIVTSMNGQVVQTTRAAYESFQRNMFEVVGRNWWSMLYDGTHYNSKDGETWTRSGQQDADWAEKAAAARESILTTMTDVACGETETVDGTVYEVYRYSHKAEKPYPTATDNVLYFDPAAGFLYRTVAHNKLAGGGTTTTTYTRDPDVRIPAPE